MYWKILTALTLAIFLSGCTKTTHFLTINPITSEPTAEFSNVHQIQVITDSQVKDNIGSIDTVLKKQADLILANDLEERVNTKVIKGLESLGFTPFQGALPAAKLEVNITQLDYVTEVKSVNSLATVQFSIRATLTADGKVYKGNYKSEMTDEFTALPSRAKVEETISKITGQTIDRLLNDPNIRILLQK
ncbi:hypothetical protein CBF23_008005 [Marinomonas agarivorans]|nr:hypothetical protein CBF23_008005 [Marinomonas agarivorans]